MPSGGGKSGGAKSLVGFRVGDVPYAIDVHRVREIIKPLPLLRLPRLPPVVIGVAEYRGEVIPVIDLRLRFGLRVEAETRLEKWIIVGRNQLSVALAVDEVSEVFEAGALQQRDLPRLESAADAPWISAVYAGRDCLVFAVETDRITAVADEIDTAAVRALPPGRGEA